MSVLIEPPLQIYTDLNGDPLEAGFIYLGLENLEPETNPINVFFDKDLLYPALQPIRTIAGAPARNGSQAILYVSDANVRYSTKIEDKNGALITSSLSSNTAAVVAAEASAAAAAAGGIVVQMVNVQWGSSTQLNVIIPIGDTIPQITEGVQIRTLAITPANASNKLRIDVVLQSWQADALLRGTGALFQDSIANALAIAEVTTNVGERASMSFTHWMTAGTIAEIIFKVRGGPDVAGNIWVNATGGNNMGGVIASSITITEIKA